VVKYVTFSFDACYLYKTLVGVSISAEPALIITNITVNAQQTIGA